MTDYKFLPSFYDDSCTEPAQEKQVFAGKSKWVYIGGPYGSRSAWYTDTGDLECKCEGLSLTYVVPCVAVRTIHQNPTYC